MDRFLCTPHRKEDSIETTRSNFRKMTRWTFYVDTLHFAPQSVYRYTKIFFKSYLSAADGVRTLHLRFVR